MENPMNNLEIIISNPEKNAVKRFTKNPNLDILYREIDWLLKYYQQVKNSSWRVRTNLRKEFNEKVNKYLGDIRAAVIATEICPEEILDSKLLG